MNIDFSEISYIQDPSVSELKADYQQFLLSLIGPTIIDITGKNTDKTRVFTTLMQGDEPSGLAAIHRWLTQDWQEQTPETNIRFIIVSVEAASKSPIFSHRHLKEGLDINRCFDSGFKHGYFQRANLIDSAIRSVNPDCVIDIHNTSGNSPAFTIAKSACSVTLNLASVFSDTLILSRISHGALTEQSFDCPTLAIEAGSYLDQQSYELLYQGICQITSTPCLCQLKSENAVKVLNRPYRLVLKTDSTLSFNNEDLGNEGVTIKNTIEQFNFGSANSGQIIGWLDSEGFEHLQLLDESNEDRIEDFLLIRENKLLLKENVLIFKATTSIDLAKNDCIFYLLKALA